MRDAPSTRGRREPTSSEVTTAIDAAEHAGLRHVSDHEPGISRRRVGRSFRYVGPDGTSIRDRATIERIDALRVPPAWTDVWICRNPLGHIQATGRDARGRKQYRYHERWRQERNATKFERMVAFGESLPCLRDRVACDLALQGLPRAKVLATVVRLLETTLVRVGNSEYAQQNDSFGLTTLRNRHVHLDSPTIALAFRGKAGKKYHIDVRDRQLARIVKRCRDLPGHELFQYLDEDGQCVSVDSADVNAYLREITEHEFSAKDFRTWFGTVLAAAELQTIGLANSAEEAHRNVAHAIEGVARRLGNTSAICRKYYVHPAVLESYMQGTIITTANGRRVRDGAKVPAGLTPAEAAVLRLLREWTYHDRG